MTERLEPCPFCGYAGITSGSVVATNSTRRVKCGQCGAMGPSKRATKTLSAELNAIAAWNERAREAIDG